MRNFDVIKKDGQSLVKAWVNGVVFDDKSRQQVENIAKMPFVKGWPDGAK